MPDRALPGLALLLAGIAAPAEPSFTTAGPGRAGDPDAPVAAQPSAAAAGPRLEVDLDGLVAAERSFAAASREKGMRAAFLEHLAEGAIIFRPGPVDGRRWFEEREPVPGRLLWRPTFARISAGGDFGYTSGPWEYRPEGEAPASHGHFVSVWGRDAGGRWRVLIDAGINHPPVPAEPVLARHVPERPAAAPLSGEARDRARTAMLAADAAFGSHPGGPRRARDEMSSGRLRLYRNGAPPGLGGDPAAEPDGPSAVRRWETLGGRVAPAGDLGYTYGTARRSPDGPETDAFLRVWERDREGPWRLTLDLTTPFGVTH